MTTLFVIVAALLVLAALASVLLPLLRNRAVVGTESGARRLDVIAANLRELDAELAARALGKEEYDEAKRELERQALEAADSAGTDRRSRHARRAVWASIFSIGIIVPVAAAGLYIGLGEPTAVAVGPGAPDSGADHASTSKGDSQLATMVDKLAKRLQQNPNDAQGWLLLARSRNAMGEPQFAVKAYEKVVALQPKDANLLVEYAETLAVAHDHDLSGQPKTLLLHALQLDPDNANALALAGAAALQAGHNDEAVRYWTHLEKQLPPNADGLPQLKALIAQAQGAPVPPATAVSPAIASISGTVVISPALADKVAPTDTVFVFARAAAGGPPMPVAVVRSSAANLPVSFTLDDSNAMSAQARLSQFANVNLYARISRTGSANVERGDLQGEVDGVSIGSSGVRILIDRSLD
jgi:cytochrome c-type biogenesis protein CcmH